VFTVSAAHAGPCRGASQFDDAAAAAYATIRAALASAGTRIGPLDTLIAAHAAALDVPLAAGNRKEFERVAGLALTEWS